MHVNFKDGTLFFKAEPQLESTLVSSLSSFTIATLCSTCYSFEKLQKNNKIYMLVAFATIMKTGNLNGHASTVCCHFSFVAVFTPSHFFAIRFQCVSATLVFLHTCISFCNLYSIMFCIIYVIGAVNNDTLRYITKALLFSCLL